MVSTETVVHRKRQPVIFSHRSQQCPVCTHNTYFEQATNLLRVSEVEGLESSETFNSFWQHHLYSIVSQTEWARPGAHRKELKQVWHQLSASQETIKPLVKGTAPGPLFYHTKWLLSANFHLVLKETWPLHLLYSSEPICDPPHLHNGQNGNEGPALSAQDKKKKEKREADWCHSVELHLYNTKVWYLESHLTTFNYDQRLYRVLPLLQFDKGFISGC